MELLSKADPFWTDEHQGRQSHTTTLVFGKIRKSIWDAFDAGDSLFAGCTKEVCIILARRNLETIYAYLGALRSGVVPLFVNGENDSQSIERLIKDFSPRYIFSSDPIAASSYEPIKSVGDAKLYESYQFKDAKIFPNLAILQPTSGSTGDSKCVRVSYENLSFVSRAISSYLQLKPGRTLITTLPLHYTFGLSLVHSAIHSGADLILAEDSITSANFWQLFTKNGVTDFSGVPFQFQILSKRGFPSAVLETLQYVSQAGGALSPGEVSWWLDYFEPRGIKFFVMYGQTEASPRISYLPPSMARQKIGSVGLPIPGGKLQVQNPNSEGEGELVYSGPNVCLGYAESVEDLGLGDELGGILQTGDIGRVDNDGIIFITGRSKRFVKLAGISVGMDSLENSIREKTEHEAAVVGQDDGLVIVIKGNPDEHLKALVLGDLGVSPNLVKVEFIDELPRLETGKIDYQQLRSLYV
jgi:long-chain acyl-CoA synthetase